MGKPSALSSYPRPCRESGRWWRALREGSLELEAQQTEQTEENQAVLICTGVSALPKSAVCTASHSLLARSCISNKNETLTEELNFMHQFKKQPGWRDAECQVEMSPFLQLPHSSGKLGHSWLPLTQGRVCRSWDDVQTQAAGQAQLKSKIPVPSMHLLCMGKELLCVTEESCKAGRSALWPGSVLFQRLEML